MRLTTGLVALLGLGVTVTVAAAQRPSARPAPQRSARLLPPQPLAPADTPPVARASGEEMPTVLETSPVIRRSANATGGPAWLNGTDPNVRPASGIVSSRQPMYPGAPPTGIIRDEPSIVSRGVDKLKSALGSQQPAAPGGTAGTANIPTANTPFQGVTASGASRFTRDHPHTGGTDGVR